MFTQKSLAALATCEQNLQELFKVVGERYPCSILQGHRNKLDQTDAWIAGKSTVPWPKSRHNSYPSQAVDVTPFPVDFSNIKQHYHFAGFVLGVANQLGIDLRWGGDWDGDLDFKDQNFNDLVHFELKKEEKNGQLSNDE